MKGYWISNCCEHLFDAICHFKPVFKSIFRVRFFSFRSVGKSTCIPQILVLKTKIFLKLFSRLRSAWDQSAGLNSILPSDSSTFPPIADHLLSTYITHLVADDSNPKPCASCNFGSCTEVALSRAAGPRARRRRPSRPLSNIRPEPEPDCYF